MKVNTNQAPRQTSQEEAPATEVKLQVDEGGDLPCRMSREGKTVKEQLRSGVGQWMSSSSGEGI